MYNFIVAMFFWLGNLLTDIIIFKKRHINPKIQTYIIEPVRRCFNLDYKRFNVVKQNNIIKKYDNNEEITNLVYDFIIEKNNLDICKIHYNDIDNENNEIIKSSFKFLSFIIKFDNNTYDINFIEPLNYLCKDNIFDIIFFKFYMKENYKLELPSQFEISYVTSKMDIKSHDQTLKFKITDNNYIIL